MFAQFAWKILHRVWKVCRHSTLFSETSGKEVSYVLCEEPVILEQLLLELRIVVIQDSEDGRRSMGKKCARKILNWYRMFAELREALAGAGALDEAKDFKRFRPRSPSTASPRDSILVRRQRSGD